MLFYITIIIWIFLDLISKYIAWTSLNSQINLIWDLLYLKYSENIWIAFSIPITWIFLKIVTIVLILSLFLYYFKFEKIKKNKLIDFSFWLILSGALANAFGRIYDSYVIDFIWVKYFAIFNIADSLIMIWVILYLIVEMKYFSSKNNS